MTDILRRGLAPLTDDAWDMVDDEARQAMRTYLAGRALVDFSGPHGWETAAANTGELIIEKQNTIDGVSWATRTSQPLMEIRVPFKVSQQEMDNVTRGADPDLDPVSDAARAAAMFEDRVIFNGFESTGVVGITRQSPYDPIPLGDQPDKYPEAVARAVESLQLAGIAGPYHLVLPPDRHAALRHAVSPGYPLLRMVNEALEGGRIWWSRALEGGVLVSSRGGDFELVVGQDFSVGYASHTTEEVELYITETFTFRVLEPGAALPLS